MGLGIDDWVVCWTPIDRQHWTERGTQKPGAIRVAQLGSQAYWDERYAFTSGACYVDRRKMEEAAKVMMLFIDFHTCVVRDGIDPQIAHREFLKIDEYRCRISPDIEGAESEAAD